MKNYLVNIDESLLPINIYIRFIDIENRNPIIGTITKVLYDTKEYIHNTSDVSYNDLKEIPDNLKSLLILDKIDTKRSLILHSFNYTVVFILNSTYSIFYFNGLRVGTLYYN